MKKTLAVFTGTRAEYGLLRPVLQKLFASEDITPLLVVTGAHLSPAYGCTVSEIENDAMPIAARIDILRFGTDDLGIAKTVAFAIDAFATWLSAAKPHAVLVLGDRYEIFAAASAAAMLGIPIAHISGGDVTLGAKDEFYRHAITKMAALHFPSCEDSARRLMRMGEAPETVCMVGGLGDENIRSLPLLSKEDLAKALAIPLDSPYYLITFHPETGTHTDATAQVNALLQALAPCAETLLFTKANADAGGAEINKQLDAFCQTRKNAYAFTNLGALRYLSAMKHAAAVVGNSSSGVVETPTFGVPCINIGERQRGRILCANVLSCAAERGDIARALDIARTDAFQNTARNVVSPYFGGDTSGGITRALAAFLSGKAHNLPKCFYDGNS